MRAEITGDGYEIEVSHDRYTTGPTVSVDIGDGSYNGVSAYMSPTEARELAQALVMLADHVERANR